jgi:hypothetical protein
MLFIAGLLGYFIYFAVLGALLGFLFQWLFWMFWKLKRIETVHQSKARSNPPSLMRTRTYFSNDSQNPSGLKLPTGEQFFPEAFI